MAKPILVVRVRDSLPALRRVVKKTVDLAWKQRIKAVLRAREGKKRKEIAEALLVSERSIGSWIGAYNAGGVAALKTKPSGRPEGNPKWDVGIFDDLTAEIDKGGYWSIPRMQAWISEHHEVNIPEQTVWYRMDQLNYSYKSARPHPAQGSKQKQQSFKKKGSYHIWSH